MFSLNGIVFSYKRNPCSVYIGKRAQMSRNMHSYRRFWHIDCLMNLNIDARNFLFGILNVIFSRQFLKLEQFYMSMKYFVQLVMDFLTYRFIVCHGIRCRQLQNMISNKLFRHIDSQIELIIYADTETFCIGM